ncbi:MAG: FGGY family carbohydrate kinase, partial [Anaerovorax sp.]
MRNLVIGCDVGTSGTKAVAMTAEGMVLASSLRNYGLITLKNNWAEQWPQIWLDAAVATIAEVALQVDVSKVACVCISALYGGTGAMLNAQMHPVRPAIIWMDRRAEAESKQVAAAIGEKEIFEISGNGIDSYFGYVKLLWVKNHEPELWKQIRHIVPIHSYIVYEMTGSLTADHCSAGNLGGLYDMNARNWSEKMCASLKIPYEILPPNLKNPADLAGKLNAIYAEKLGLLEGTPFAVGTVDCIASMLSAGVVSQGDNAAVLGTSLNWGYVHQG